MLFSFHASYAMLVQKDTNCRFNAIDYYLSYVHFGTTAPVMSLLANWLGQH